LADSDLNLETVRRNIIDPHRWADSERILQVLEETPSVRGMVYGNFAEAMFVDELISVGIPIEDQSRDDDHAKTKSDRTFVSSGRTYTVQLKSMQTNSIRQLSDGTFSAKIQCDASDRRPIVLPNGRKIETTCYQAGEFDILAVPLQPFLGTWRYAFRMNASLPRSRYRGYDDDIRKYLLATLVPITWPLGPEWTRDLIGLITASGEKLGKLVLADD
jgi:hypothetical protein